MDVGEPKHSNMMFPDVQGAGGCRESIQEQNSKSEHFENFDNLDFENPDFLHFGRPQVASGRSGRPSSTWNCLECLGPPVGPADTRVTRVVTDLECVEPGCYPTF